MKRILTALAGAILTGLTVLTLTSGTAYAAAGWGDSVQGQQTYTIRDFTNSIDTVKIVIAVQYFSNTDNTNLSTVTAVRVRCSVRNLNGAYVTGVRVDDCALGTTVPGSAALRGCDTGCPALDGGTCCANAWSGLRFVQYVPGFLAFRGRGTISYRGQSGTLYTNNWTSQPTSASWDLT
jgi:hypothetical protein